MVTALALVGIAIGVSALVLWVYTMIVVSRYVNAIEIERKTFRKFSDEATVLLWPNGKDKTSALSGIYRRLETEV